MKDLAIMPLRSISPTEAKALLDEGAVLIDVRERDERAHVRIACSESLPLSELASAALPAKTKAVIFHCAGGKRTRANAAALAAKAPCEAFALEGGLDAWRAAGLPVIVDRTQPIEIMRQVQIAAGSLVLLGLALGTFVSPLWYGLTACVGAGLVFAGVSGSCAMAKLLAFMPWNRSIA
jgi:rhodanese-related sulfurtransferase